MLTVLSLRPLRLNFILQQLQLIQDLQTAPITHWRTWWATHKATSDLDEVTLNIRRRHEGPRNLRLWESYLEEKVWSRFVMNVMHLRNDPHRLFLLFSFRQFVLPDVFFFFRAPLQSLKLRLLRVRRYKTVKTSRFTALLIVVQVVVTFSCSSFLFWSNSTCSFSASFSLDCSWANNNNNNNNNQICQQQQNS